MTFQTLARRVRNPGLPLGLRYVALRSALEYYRRLGYHASWSFITGTDARKPRPLDEPGLLNALERLETSRNAWLVEMEAFAERRTVLKREHGIPADREETRYRQGRRWSGPDAHAATVVAVAQQWRLDRPYAAAALMEPFAPLEQELSGLVESYLGSGLDAQALRRLPALHRDIDNVRRDHVRNYHLRHPTARLGKVAELIRYEVLPLVRRGWVGDAERIADIFWAARGRMTYLPDLYTFDQTRWWIEHVMAPQSELWIAERRGVPVGFAALNGRWLDHLYIEPAHQGRGIGEALLARAKRRRPELDLRVFEQNHGARAFYARQGFSRIGSGDGSDNEERLPDLHLRWRR
ncbi:GNAT family N-acetyltransferase [Glycomyces sp. YM15]|uniref:GNAT family N-acetyltransferase n=1 Tax=Glycomyces sp. YM15 TaxID=2800446 RepID=UPI00196379B1|nr:GNAT family N-acetyltransferase [Glycomyces sp. YM15]